MRKRLEELRKAGEDVPAIMKAAAKAATIAAVETAVNATPPNGAALSGTNTRSGQLAQHWAVDSVATPKTTGGSVETQLNNNMEYASYVNDGHRVDKHFVPGLVKNGNVLEYNPGGKEGIMVGTKTTYVPGLHMKEKGVGAYRSAVRTELKKRMKERFR